MNETGTHEIPTEPREAESPPVSGLDGPRADLDATHLFELNRRLRELAQRRDDLLSLAAADLRAPTASILRQLRQLRAHPSSETARHLIDALGRQARRVAALADGLRALTTIEEGRLQLKCRPTELVSLLSRLIEQCARKDRANAVELACELPAYPVTLSADPARLQGALTALLEEAIRSTPHQGRARVRLEALPANVRITVETGGRPKSPAGVELAVCRGLAELHGGTLELVDQGDEPAAVLTLPYAPAEEPAPPPREPAKGKPRLLVVDDDPDVREALAMMLGDDYEVILARDGQEAMEAAFLTRLDVVLMDLFMPRMDGLAALEALRGDPLTEQVPVILISGRGDDLTRSRSLDLGAIDFMQKPFSGRELKARIERTLRLTRRETQLQALARTDPLTGLANLRAFRSRLADEVKRACRYRTPLACVMVDMDQLKPINDELGHGAGDIAIGSLAHVIQRELRETDFGARYGGDEFVVLLPHTSADEARVFAERVLTRLKQTSIEVSGRRLPLGASIGIAALGEELLDNPGDALVRRADEALYMAKRAGRGMVSTHPSSDAQAASPP
ncbi:MAG TPA: diguanylate cyclase [Anaeromyxobacteraceae bacterium]|nr:diguanylate cyclase [Anaeromyxobacteraceae bacterium]